MTGRVVGLSERFDTKIAGLPREPGEADRFLRTAIAPVPDEYNQKTFAEAARVRSHLEHELAVRGVPVTFEYQGSVTNGTNIKYWSDIDLLTLTGKYFSVLPPLRPTHPYQGTPTDDLWEVRVHAADILARAFPAASVDNGGSKCIAISGGSLQRRIEVVPADWLETVASQSGDASRRGIHVLDKNRWTRVMNFPFLHNARIEEKDRRVWGQFRPLARLAKCIRYDADAPIKLSSYDLVGLCYCLPDTEYLQVGSAEDPRLLLALVQFADSLVRDPVAAARLLVPNDTRPLFGSEGIDAGQLSKWVGEALAVLRDVVGASRSAA